MNTFASEFNEHLNRLACLERPGRPVLSCFRKLIHLRETPSTNGYAWELAEKSPACHGTVIIADTQTSGRGRFGRTWQSKPLKGLYASFVLAPEQDLKVPHILTTAGAIAAAETMAGFYDAPVRIRWPNDIVSAEGRKLAGILVETRDKAGKQKVYVLGIGINLNHSTTDFPGELKPTASSLHILSGQHVNRALFLAQLVFTLSEWYGHILDEHYDLLSEKWQTLSALINKRVELLVNGSTVTGRVVDLHITDGIIVQLDTGVIKAFKSEFVEKLEIK